MTGYGLLDWAPEPPAGTVLTLSEVMVPMRWWRGVLLYRQTPATTTPLERFTIEMALRLGRADPDEFFHITGLPAALLPVAARRLVTAGALSRSGEGFEVVRPVADQVATTRTVYQAKPEPFDVVLLPRTGDLIAFSPKASWLQAADRARLRPIGRAPVPSALRGRTLAHLLTERLAGPGGVPGLGGDITGVFEQSGPSPTVDVDGLCQVYRGAAVLRIDDRGTFVPVLTLDGGGRKRTVEARLPGADGLARRWLEPVDALDTAAVRARAWHEATGGGEWVAPRVDRVHTGRWRCWIDGADAQRLAAHPRNLSLPLGVEVRGDECIAEVAFELTAADGAAAAAIDLDRLLSAAAQPGTELAGVPRTEAARARAWQLGLHALVYSLREAEDFAYG